MPYHRKQEDGSYEKNVILKKIYKDFGSLRISYNNLYGMTYSKSYCPGLQKRPKLENRLRTANVSKYDAYTPNGTARYSKIDKFIDNLNQACAALPKPLVEDFGRVRPSTVAVQSQPKKEVSVIKVRGNEPTSTQPNTGGQRDDQAVSTEDSDRPRNSVKSGLEQIPREAQLNISPSLETEPRKNADQGHRDCGRQGAKPCLDDHAFESRKQEVVRAATMLQSRYRGYKVRRSQPLKYMLMIGSAKSKLEELKQQFNSWKIAVWFPTDYSERLAMTENVMNLLVELDSIQGVPLYIREFKKSVARDVIKFQDEVHAFFRHNTKRGALFDLVGNDNTRYQKDRTDMRTGNPRIINESGCGIEPPNSWETVELAGNPQTEFGPLEEAGDFNSDEWNSAGRAESEAEDSIQCDQLEQESNVSMGLQEVVQPQEDSILYPQPPVELQVGSFSYPQSSVELAGGADIKISHEETNQRESVGTPSCDVSIPLKEGSSRTSRKKKYVVRFEDDVKQGEINPGIQSCLATEQSLESSNEDSSAQDEAIVKSDDQCYVASNCSEESGRRELTQIHEQRDVVYPNASTAVLVAKKLVGLATHAPDAAESRTGKDQPGYIGALFGEALASEHLSLTIRVHSSESLDDKTSGFMEEPSCLDTNGHVSVERRVKYQALMADTRNPSTQRYGVFGEVTIPPKSRFHNEQAHLRTSPPDASVRPGHSVVNCQTDNFSDGAFSETSEALEGMEEHERKLEVLRPEAKRMKIPPLRLEQKQMVTFTGSETDIGAVLKSPRLWGRRSCGDSQSISTTPRNALDERTSDVDADIEIESDVEVDGVPEVDNLSCCSDCARPRGHYPFECGKLKGTKGEEERRRGHPCNEYPREVQEEYVPVGRDDYCRPPELAGFSGFDHRELKYVADPCTLKLRRARQGAECRNTKNGHIFPEREKCRLLPRAAKAVGHAPKASPHKETSYTPSPPESICSEAERSYRRFRNHSPSRQIAGSGERRPWETDECQCPDKELVTLLMDDNKRLKGLLKDFMNWNKAQTTAMVSMSERIEHLEGLDNLP